MRSISEGAKAAVSGADETLWQACMERADIAGRVCLLLDALEIREIEAEQIIRAMSPEERALYEISEE